MGLMGRRAVDPQEGLLFVGATSIHMFFMRTSIDCLFLAAPDGEGQQRIVSLRRRLPRWRGVVWFVRGARDTLELAPGTIDRANMHEGDDVRLEPAASAR
jgi:uncharacterized membrane protein (UPF0127 family)